MSLAVKFTDQKTKENKTVSVEKFTDYRFSCKIY